MIHLIDVTQENVIEAYGIIRNELEMYKNNLDQKPEIIVFNKIDALETEEIEKLKKTFEEKYEKNVFLISAIKKDKVFDVILQKALDEKILQLAENVDAENVDENSDELIEYDEILDENPEEG